MVFFQGIRIARKKLPSPRVQVQDFHEISTLEPNRTAHGTIGIDCGDTTQNVGLTIECSGREYDVTLKPKICEMLRPIAMTQEQFDKAKRDLSGLNENYSNVELPGKIQASPSAVLEVVLETANVATVKSQNEEEATDSQFTLRFVGETVSSSAPVLISVAVRGGTKTVVTVNCEKVMVGSVVLQELREAFAKAWMLFWRLFVKFRFPFLIFHGNLVY